MDLSSVLHQARQGDPEAIATLLTQALASQGVTVQARMRQGCLEVALTAAKIPDQAFCLKVLRQGLVQLNIPKLQTVRAMGLRQGEPFPEWMEVFSLEPPPVTPVPSPSDSNYDPPPSRSNGHYSPALTRDPDLPTQLLAEELLRRYERGQRNFSGVQLNQAALIEAVLDGIILQEADLSRCILRRVRLTQAQLQGANLAGANLIEADLTDADMSGCNLSPTKLTGQAVQALVGASVPVSTNLKRAILVRVNLSQADLSRVNGEEARFDQARLHRTVLARFNGKRASFVGADLTQADVSWAILDGANLTQVDFGCANLKRCNLVGANLTGANFNGADLTEANFLRANLTAVDLRKATLNSTQMPDGSIKFDKRYAR
ncbi:pentapeptide repeat-containing protein [Gloeomargarita lithophora Alchichica-D10]|uniref:Pentapeptide repeat-containing protein n=1 Tax=Gloeomargarita lithophora Alchichica-D10 TaxID=1188229 RepID=A0A1J0AEI2_9CYAN|nr:pentapeptide repeat-containing protein [Gloeomargarita lithophora]APB34341.1 pentapeptide repeat-containing protein [Gloeomargarita lithophora Alchichica-D10]